MKEFYGFAWVGHFVFEKNHPASFKRPLYSFIGDWAMYRDIWLLSDDAGCEAEKPRLRLVTLFSLVQRMLRQDIRT